jgi:capsular polysaccharide biosynthesis protein
VERFFADRGYHVFYPEELPLPEQARLFAGARVVAGFGGSAMFNLMHCQRLEAAVVISHHAYVARNEHLFTSVLGGQLHYFWQTSDVPPPAVGRNKASSGSSFAFDFEAYGDDLARVLADL